MWFNILKTQETITDIGIDFDLPEKVESKDKKDKCCEEARNMWIGEVRKDIGQDEGYDIPPGGYLDGENLQNTSIIHKYETMSCEELRGVFEDISGRKPGYMYMVHYTERKKHFGYPTYLHNLGAHLLREWEKCEKYE